MNAFCKYFIVLFSILAIITCFIIIYKKWSGNARLINVIKIKILIANIKSVFIVLFYIAVFILLISSSIWLEGLQIAISNSDFQYLNKISELIADNMDILNSMIGIAIGSALVFAATYIAAKRDENKKILGSKEIAFYVPMLAELVEIERCMSEYKVVKFQKEGHLFRNSVVWRFYEDISSTIVKFHIPNVFETRIKKLDVGIRKYMLKRDLNIAHFKLYIPTKLSKYGYVLEDGKYNMFENIFEDVISENIIIGEFDKRNFCDGVDVDEIKKYISELVKHDQKYCKFIIQHKYVYELVVEIVEGINYIVYRINKKYKGKNKLI